MYYRYISQSNVCCFFFFFPYNHHPSFSVSCWYSLLLLAVVSDMKKRISLHAMQVNWKCGKFMRVILVSNQSKKDIFLPIVTKEWRAIYMSKEEVVSECIPLLTFTPIEYHNNALFWRIIIGLRRVKPLNNCHVIQFKLII